MSLQLISYYQKFYQLIIKKTLNNTLIDSQWNYFNNMLKNINTQKQRIQLYLTVLQTQKRKKQEEITVNNSNKYSELQFSKTQSLKQNRKNYQDSEQKDITHAFDSIQSAVIPRQISQQKYANLNNSYKKMGTHAFSHKKQYSQLRLQKRNHQIPQVQQFQKRTNVKFQQNHYLNFGVKSPKNIGLALNNMNKLLQIFEETQAGLILRCS